MSDIKSMEKKANRSASAKALADRKYHQRIVVSKKIYNRKKLEKKYA